MKVDINWNGSYTDVNITIAARPTDHYLDVKEVLYRCLNDKFAGRKLDDALRHEVERFVTTTTPLLFLLASLGIRI